MVSKILTVTVPNDPVQVIEVQVPGQAGPAGPPGPPGPPDLISIGTVTTGAPGTQTLATISGATPNRFLNLTIPRGDQGIQGPPNTLTIGTINTLAEGQQATATITGTAPNQILNLSIPRGYGVRSGGAVGDVLQKLTAADYDTGWIATNAQNVGNTIAKRDSAGDIAFNKVVIGQAPTLPEHGTRKDYVDSADLAFRRRGSDGALAAAYTLDLANEGKLLYRAAGPATVTIPTNATLAVPIGAWYDFMSSGAGVLTIVPANGVTLIGPEGQVIPAGGVTPRSQWSTVRIHKYAVDSWIISGDLSHTHTAANISDSTTVGRAVVTATDAAAARAAIGAGTSSLVIGTTSTTAKAGDYSPPNANETARGLVELATAAETTTGTDNTRAVHPAGLKVELDKKSNVSAVEGIVTHDGTAGGGTRPTGFVRVRWVSPTGAVHSRPTNMVAGDIWEHDA